MLAGSPNKESRAVDTWYCLQRVAVRALVRLCHYLATGMGFKLYWSETVDKNGPCVNPPSTKCKSAWGLYSLATHTLRREEGSGHAATDELLLRNAIIKLHCYMIRDWYLLNTLWQNCYSITTDESANLIGHSKFQPWWQLDGCSITRSPLVARSSRTF